MATATKTKGTKAETPNILDQLRKLNEEQERLNALKAGIVDQAKDALLTQAQHIIDELRSLGLEFEFRKFEPESPTHNS